MEKLAMGNRYPIYTVNSFIIGLCQRFESNSHLGKLGGDQKFRKLERQSFKCFSLPCGFRGLSRQGQTWNVAYWRCWFEAGADHLGWWTAHTWSRRRTCTSTDSTCLSLVTFHGRSLRQKNVLSSLCASVESLRRQTLKPKINENFQYKKTQTWKF